MDCNNEKKDEELSLMKYISLTLIVAGMEDIKRNDVNSWLLFAVNAAIRRDAIENMMVIVNSNKQ